MPLEMLTRMRGEKIRVPAELTLTPGVLAAASARFSAAERAELAAGMAGELRGADPEARMRIVLAAVRGLGWGELERLIGKLRDLQTWLRAPGASA